jgi:hypothetical protein
MIRVSTTNSTTQTQVVGQYFIKEKFNRDMVSQEACGQITFATIPMVYGLECHTVLRLPEFWRATPVV